MTNERVRIALQKTGRLSDNSMDLLRKCGLHIDRSRDQLYCRIKELPIDLLLVRDDDIPGFVKNAICDLGVVGDNLFQERSATEGTGFSLRICEHLGFSKCRLSIAAPEQGFIQTLEDLNGKTVATSYPSVIKQFLASKGIDANILTMSGSVEVAPRLKIADAICDIVSSGVTLAANNLSEIAVVLQSEALLIRSKNPLSPTKEKIVERLISRMRGAIRAEDSKYIMMNAPRSAIDNIAKLLPGCDSPTIMELTKENMVAIHAVSKEAIFWETLEKLQEAGATGILVLPIEKMTA